MPFFKFNNGVPFKARMVNISNFQKTAEYIFKCNYKHLSKFTFMFRQLGKPVPENILRPNGYRHIFEKNLGM